MKDFLGFTNQFSLTKTLRFDLIPQGRTLENIQKKGLLEHDENLGNESARVKALIDGYHKHFIDMVLKNLELDWTLLEQGLIDFSSNRDYEKLNAAQQAQREKVSKEFRSHKDFNVLFSADLIRKVLPGLVEMQGNEDDTQALDKFDRFTTYFLDFQENRRNMYTDAADGTAIANRIVNENFTRHFQNMKVFKEALAIYPDAIEKTAEELRDFLDGIDIKDIFTAEKYNLFLSQEGIDYYNLLLGGKTTDDGKKIRGVNEFLNLAHQQSGGNKKRIRLQQLHKQILSDRSTHSFVYDSIENDKEALGVFKGVIESLTTVSANPDNISFFDQALLFSAALKDSSLEDVLINRKMLSNLSIALFGNHYAIKNSIDYFDGRRLSAVDKLSNKQKKEWTESAIYSFQELKDSFEGYSKSHEDSLNLDISKFQSRIKEGLETVQEKISSINFQDLEDSRIQGNAENIALIKDALDSILDLNSLIKTFVIPEESRLQNEFYFQLGSIEDCLFPLIPAYNKLRNYLTIAVPTAKKYRLYLGNNEIGSGWSVSKEKDYGSVMFRKGNHYYLGVMNKENRREINFDNNLLKDESGGNLEKMYYYLYPDAVRMIPKQTVSIAKRRNHFESSDENFILSDRSVFHEPLEITSDLFYAYYPKEGEKKTNPKYKEINEAEYKKYVQKWIDFCIEFLEKNVTTSNFDFSKVKEMEFEAVADFYKEVNKIAYKLSFKPINENYINELVEEGKLFLFQIYSKDFSPKSTGTKNLHTMYFEGLFDEEAGANFRLNGSATLFYREAAIDNPFVHKKGETLVNKTTISGELIPNETYRHLSAFYSGQVKASGLSKDAKSLLERNEVVTRPAPHDIVKNKRYASPKFQFHVPITLNANAGQGEPRVLRDSILDKATQSENQHVIGIDRGERNLIYVSVIDSTGKIVEQKSLNLINGTDYQEKLDDREKERQASRRSWKSVTAIKSLKEGYISLAVHEVTQLMIKYDALIVLEDLNQGFKRSRTRIEKQVYQKFENMLASKLQYYVDKKLEPTSPGGALNGLQLCPIPRRVGDLRGQFGALIYVPAWRTSKIDPTTGFSKVHNFRYTNVKAAQDLIASMSGIRYSGPHDYFEFVFDLKKMNITDAGPQKIWTVCTHNPRRWKAVKNEAGKFEYVAIDVTKELKNLFTEMGINYTTGKDLIQSVLSISEKKLYSSLLFLLRHTLEMRYSNPSTGDDWIISPVRNKEGVFFDTSKEADPNLPIDADANGAYCIALKGLQYLEASKDGKKYSPRNNDWLAWLQEKAN